MDRHAQEIERKWLVRYVPTLEGLKYEQIHQGYLAISSDGTEVRIRRKGDTCFETVKSRGDLTRDEIEVELSQEQFRMLWPVTEGRRLEKNTIRIELERPSHRTRRVSRISYRIGRR